MENEKEQNTLPKWCHAVLPQDGSLVIITYGEPGYKRSTLESKDREENRRIADRENAKIGKITLQQEKTMIAGALLGWKPLTGSAGNCELYEDVHTDYQLGKYAVEHRMVKELESMPQSLSELLDYESIGRKKRHGDKGIFLAPSGTQIKIP